MEIIISAFQSGGWLLVFVVVLAKIIELLVSNDLDFIFFSKLKQKIGILVNGIWLFILNMLFILSCVMMVYEKFSVNLKVKSFIYGCIIAITIILIMFMFVPKKKPKPKFIKRIVECVKEKISVLLMVIFIVVNVYAVLETIYIISLADLGVYNILIAIVIAFLYSILFMILISLLRNIKYSDGKIAKFYLRENDEKYYIYHAQGKFLMCGTDINSDKAEKYKLIKLDEIDNYEIFRESEQINDKPQIELNKCRILDKIKQFFISIKNKVK